MDINSAIQQLLGTAGQVAGNIPLPQIPKLDFQMPSGSDISAKWNEFLTQASKDPGIVTYYNNLLAQAQGDTNLAIGFLEKDYQTGVRQTQANLQGTLEQLGVTSTQEQQGLQNTLNQRQIGLTQGPNNTTQYAGGGQAGTELGNLNESQKLRQEAQQRSAGQQIESMGLARQKGISSAGSQAQQYGLNLQHQKEQDIYQKAYGNYGIWQNQQNADYTNAVNQQNQAISTGSSQVSGDPKNMSQAQRQNLWDTSGKTGIAPVGYGGG